MIRISDKNNQPLQQSDVQLSASDREFIARVANRVTVYGQIPYSLPERLVVDLIMSSARFFYKFDSKTWERRMFYILNSAIKTYMNDVAQVTSPMINNLSGKTQNFGLQLPKNILVVRGVGTTTSGGHNRFNDEEAWDMADYPSSVGTSAIGINDNLFIIEKACMMQQAKVFESVFKSTVRFDYTPSTAFLTIFNLSYEQKSLVLDCEKAVNIDTLYNDSYFERHVIGCYKRELKRVIAGHTFELPGGVTMSADEICAGIDDIEKVEELVKNSGGVGDIIIKR